MDILEMSFDGKIYVHGQHRQLLMTKEKYDTSKDNDTYMSLAHDVVFTKITEKRESNMLENKKLRPCSKSTNNSMMYQCPESQFLDQLIMRN